MNKHMPVKLSSFISFFKFFSLHYSFSSFVWCAHVHTWCMCMCVHVYACLYVHTGMHLYVCTMYVHAWVVHEHECTYAHDHVSTCAGRIWALLSENSVSHWNGSSPFWLAWLASKLPGSTCVCWSYSPVTGIDTVLPSFAHAGDQSAGTHVCTADTFTSIFFILFWRQVQGSKLFFFFEFS